ncbi:baseplate J/gp47 family protein [Desulfuribacillus alkaliarsenatis]|uniref:Uncharacterized protein n=1 Tax=Desulfuribacillus alkaliarsenatis TaxID=766136 RepID=A0A1E5G2B9_9FIRM|nr:baseplate J/gp47 family protein [Desulfuribacillus alkaliarsenatis]OEF97119.1 hypothetical protein BHF68_05855 [Desulfuribacillus alkaliarsenatis]
MLDIPGKVIKDRGRLMSDAKKQLTNQYPIWTDHAPHDPGITLLELLAELQVRQQESIRLGSEQNRQKYLAMLQFYQKPAQSAQTEVMFASDSRKEYLPKGSRLMAQDLTFETCERLVVVDNQLQAIQLEIQEKRVLIDRSSSVDWSRDWYAFGEMPKPGDSLYLGFDKPFPANTTIHTKWNLADGQISRNAVNSNDFFQALVKLSWEYYGIEKGVEGWHPLQVVSDTTRDLLYSGFLQLKLFGKQILYPGDNNSEFGYYAFRCRLVEGAYDVAPRIRQIHTNCIIVKQRRSLCQSWTFKNHDIINREVLIDSWLAYYGILQVFIRKYDGWVELKETSQYRVHHDTRKKRCRIQILSELTRVLTEVDGATDDAIVKVIAWENAVWQKKALASSTGWIHQQIELELKHVLEQEFKLMVAEHSNGEIIWRDWYPIETLEHGHDNQLCFQLDPTLGLIRFGDNRKGRAPDPGVNSIMITDCAITRANQGNILSAKIDSIVVPDEQLKDLTVQQLEPATGGQTKETIQQLERRLIQDLNTEYRAISTNDYQRIVENTPGLVIKNVKVLPLYKPGLSDYPNKKADNCVTIVVEPYNKSGQGQLTEVYKKNIIANLDRYRLITTQTFIIEPTYVGLEFYGEIIIKANYMNAEQDIKLAINQYIKKIEQRQIGRVVLNYGELYGIVDLLECVSHIRYLGIEPVGYRITKSKNGDITIPAYSRFYISKAELILIHSEQG